jgi:hypothetical protein
MCSPISDFLTHTHTKAAQYPKPVLQLKKRKREGSPINSSKKVRQQMQQVRHACTSFPRSLSFSLAHFFFFVCVCPA